MRVGRTEKKILLLLFGGVALGLSGSPRRYFRILNALHEEWSAIDARALKQSARSLYTSKLVDARTDRDGRWVLVLSDKGKRAALAYRIDEMRIPAPKYWDGKWRMVLFDIPESTKKIREALRTHLKCMGFLELQKSIFIHPFECRNEIEYVVEFYNIRKHVRFVLAESIDNGLNVQQHFGLDK